MILWVQIIVSNVAVALVIGGVAAGVGRGGRRATLAHALWVAFFVKLITPPLLWVPIAVPADWLPPTASSTSAAPLNAAISAANPAVSGNHLPHPISARPVAAVAESTAAAISAAHLWTIAGLVWIVGFSFILVRGLIRYVRFRRFLRREGVRDRQATLFVGQLLRSEPRATLLRTGRRHSPVVLRIPARVSPMLFGVGSRAVIVCPNQLWRSLGEHERHACLAHEAAHYYRRDHWIRWLEWFVTALYWWFPGVYVARRQLERHEEAACDAWAVRKLGSVPRRYAEALLRVVDFLSEHQLGIPRLASGMQPTRSLEQRLRLLIGPNGTSQTTRPVRAAAGASCMLLWILHPSLQPLTGTRESLVLPAAIDPRAASTAMPPHALPDASPESAGSDLPEPPGGFWTHRSRRQWADLSLTLPGSQLIAEAGRGISIERLEGEPLRFSNEQLSAITEIPSTRRVVIGDASGRLRLWDLQAGLPTSLIGRHGAQIASLAYHESCGIISADAAGSVTRWDLQSGQLLATWSGLNVPVQSIRCSGNGRTVAVLVGSWRQLDTAEQVCFVDASSLESQSSTSVSPGTAVVLHVEPAGWVTVEWSGAVRLLESGRPIGAVAKHDVSALVLSQDAPLSWIDAKQQENAVRIPVEELR